MGNVSIAVARPAQTPVPRAERVPRCEPRPLAGALSVVADAVQEDARVVAPIPDAVEARDAVLAARHRLAVAAPHDPIEPLHRYSFFRRNPSSKKDNNVLPEN